MRRHEILPEIIDAIAEVENCSPHDIDFTLYDYVDTAAIRSLWASKNTDWEMKFRVPGHSVMVRGDGEIIVDGDVIRGITESALEE